mgnify:CR=1 FL=1
MASWGARSACAVEVSGGRLEAGFRRAALGAQMRIHHDAAVQLQPAARQEIGVGLDAGGDHHQRDEGDVRDRLDRVAPRLPEEARCFGVTTMKRSPSITLMVHIISPQGTYDDLYMGNYAFLHVKDRLARLRDQPLKPE